MFAIQVGKEQIVTKILAQPVWSTDFGKHAQVEESASMAQACANATLAMVAQYAKMSRAQFGQGKFAMDEATAS